MPHRLCRGGVALVAIFYCSAGIAADADPRDPQAILDALATIGRRTAFTTAEQGAAALPLIRLYTQTVNEPSRQPPLDELRFATELVVSSLYWRPAAVSRLRQEGSGQVALTLATLEMNAALVRRLRSRGSAEELEARTLLERLQKDLFWYNAQDDARVWDRAATLYAALFLPGEGDVDAATYGAFLRQCDTGTAIGRRIVERTYRRVGTHLDGMIGERRDLDDVPMESLRLWGDLQRSLSGAWAERSSDADRLTGPARQAYRAWETEKFVLPLRRLLARPMGRDQRLILARMLYDGMQAEGGIGAVATRVRRFGLEPEAIITAFPHPGPAAPFPYGLGRWASTLLDLFRISMGCDNNFCLAFDREGNGDPGCFRRNGTLVFLATLAMISAEQDDPDSDIDGDVRMLLGLYLRGAALLASLQSHPPDMAMWGENAAIFLSVQGGRGGATVEEWNDAKVAMLSRLFLDSRRQDGTRSAGLLSLHETRLAEMLSRDISTAQRREQVTNSPWHRDAVAQGRQEFLAAFLAALPENLDAQAALRRWQFPPDEIAAARQLRAKHADKTATVALHNE